MSEATLHIGDVFDVAATLETDSVDLVVSSPPFLGLRHYLADDDPAKHKEIGAEATPAEFVGTLLDLVAALSDPLARYGTMAFELGDKYAGGGNGTDAKHLKARHAENSATRWTGEKEGWPLDKSLCMIPEAFRFALAWGINPFTGEPSPAGKWRVRNVVRWVKPSPPSGAIGDKWRPATTDMVVITKASDRYFDGHAVLRPYSVKSNPRTATGVGTQDRTAKTSPDTNFATLADLNNSGRGAPPKDYVDAVDRVLAASIDQHNDNGWDLSSVELSRALRDAGLMDWGDAWEIQSTPYPGAHHACVDDETEALTRSGWKRHTDLRDGDDIAVVDPETMTWRMEPATFHRYDYDGEMVSIERRTTSQLLTPNHRVLYNTRKDRTPRIREAAELKAHDFVPVAAPMEPGGHGPGPVAAAIAGWFCSEGGLLDKRYQYPVIWQSETANPDHCDAIRRLLIAGNVPLIETSRVQSRYDGTPRVLVQWRLKGPVAEWVSQFHKNIPWSVVFGWPVEDIRAFFDAMIDGDGHRRSDGRITFVQKSKRTIDAMQVIAARLGYRTSISPKEPDTYSLWISPARSWVDLRNGKHGKGDPFPRQHYTGTVWCPNVSTGVWFARRDNKPFITGNTFPSELVVDPVKAFTPHHVCVGCGEPRRRIVNPAASDGAADTWSDCGCGAGWRPGCVLDPFVGSGTTMAVAHGHGRSAVGVDLDSRNEALVRERLGMFLNVVHHDISTSEHDEPSEPDGAGHGVADETGAV